MSLSTEERGIIIRLASLSLSLSVLESGLPHVIPFLRLGLGNIALLWGLGRLPGALFILLCALRWLLSAFMAGTLLSPYGLAGLAGSAASCLAMLLFHRLAGKRLSYYSLSPLGSMASGAAQLLVSSLVLSTSVMGLLPLMLTFNLASGLVTGIIAAKAEANLVLDAGDASTEEGGRWTGLALLHIPLIIITALADKPWALLLLFLAALMSCHLAGRRIRPGLYAVSFISVVLFNLLSPSGRIIASFITEGALMDGIRKGLVLLSLTALSQSFAASGLRAGGLPGQVLTAYGRLNAALFQEEGSFKERLRRLMSGQGQDKGGGDRPVRTMPRVLVLTAAALIALIA